MEGLSMRLIGLLFIVTISILSGCSYQTQSENFVIWDNSHFSVFGIENFRDFVTILGSHGLGVKTSNNLKDLQGKCLIIAGSTSTYTEDEIGSEQSDIFRLLLYRQCNCLM